MKECTGCLVLTSTNFDSIYLQILDHFFLILYLYERDFATIDVFFIYFWCNLCVFVEFFKNLTNFCDSLHHKKSIFLHFLTIFFQFFQQMCKKNHKNWSQHRHFVFTCFQICKTLKINPNFLKNHHKWK